MPDFRFWRWKKDHDEDVDREIDVHLALEVDDQLDAGVSPEEAKYAARRALGNVTLLKEELREMRTTAPLDRIWQGIGDELRQAARRLWRTPAFTMPAALTLALAIGANASIFAVVHRVVLNPLPYGDSERLVALDFGMPIRNVASGLSTIPSRLYYQYRDRSRALNGIAVYRADEVNLTGEGNVDRIRIVRTTASLAPVLRVAPVLGRWFSEAEDLPGASQVAVLSHGLWVRRYGREQSILGRIVRLDGIPTTVVGVMPASYAFPDPGVDMWIPASLTPATASDAYNLRGVARLADGATISVARSEMTTLAVSLEAAHPTNGYAQLVSTSTSLIDATVGRVSRVLWILLASVGLVLLVACANVSNLFLVRSEVRQREVAVRRALGAGTPAIARYFLSESALLSVLSGLIGLGVAWGAIQMLIALGPRNLPRLEEIRLDIIVVGFTGALCLFTTIAFGSIPLFRMTPLVVSLNESGRGHSASRRGRRARQFLMGAEVALALVLLVSSGLMLRSFQKLRAVDPGFDARSALTFRVGLPQNDYADRRKTVAAHLAILDRVSALPGVRSAAASTCLPLAEQLCPGGPLFVEGRPLPVGSIAPFVRIHAVSGGYFGTMGMRLLRGRGVDQSDVERDEPIAVVNDALVRISFPDQDPVGQRIRLGNPSLAPGAPEWLTIVGVVANTPYTGLSEPTPSAQMFIPMFASRNVNNAPRRAAMSFVVRTTLAPEELTAAVRGAVGGVDPNVALAQVRTLQDILDRASAQMAFTMLLLVIAAGTAILLGVIGIYGVMSYIVTQRTAEIGLRLSLGATPASVARAIVREGGIVAIVGVGVGVVIALASGRLMSALIYGISPRDPIVFAATTVGLFGLTLLACWVPARRAAKLNPVEALRTS
jgi:putative ABC transport system permease protein